MFAVRVGVDQGLEGKSGFDILVLFQKFHAVFEQHRIRCNSCFLQTRTFLSTRGE